MSQIHGTGDHRLTTQGLNQQAPGSLKGANKSHKVTVGCGPGTGRKGNFFTKLTLKVSDFARSIFSATAALDIKRDKTEIRELTEKQSKITAPIKAAKKAEIEAKIKKLNDKIEILKKSLSYERDRQPFDMTFNSSVADTEKELADARKELKEAQSRLKKIK